MLSLMQMSQKTHGVEVEMCLKRILNQCYHHSVLTGHESEAAASSRGGEKRTAHHACVGANIALALGRVPDTTTGT